jgi:tetratricopeptide (TPR) repeat protein
VHWFLSAAATQPPPWFEEGIAEVFSTFEVKSGKARWGAAIQDDIDYLRAYGVQPLDEFLRIVKSDVLHSEGYYPQAWLFMHYMMFGDNGANLPKFREFIRLRRETDLDTAFAHAFGKTYKEMTAELRAYLQGGRYRIALLDTMDHSAELTAGPAPSAAVEFALARLAVAGGNDELGRRHVESVVLTAPNAPEGYELRAELARRAGDVGAALNDLDRAIALGSKDADTFYTKAFLVMEANQRDGVRADELLPHDLARTIADLFDRSIDLRPRSPRSYEGLSTALLNVQVVTDQDDAALAAGRRALPSDGVVLVGQAVIARQRGSFAEATQLLRRARAEPFDLPVRYHSFVTNLYNVWLVDWLATQVQRLDDTSHVADAQAFLEEQSADKSLAESSLNLIRKLKGELTGVERFQAGLAARREGHNADADAIFAEVANDSSLSPPLRGAARNAARAH